MTMNMETIGLTTSMTLPVHHEDAEMSEMLIFLETGGNLKSELGTGYGLGFGSGSGSNMNLGLGLGSGGLSSGNGLGSGAGLGSGNANGLGSGLGSGGTLQLQPGYGSGMGLSMTPPGSVGIVPAQLLISPVNSASSSPSVTHLSNRSGNRTGSRDSTSSLGSIGSMEETTLGVSPNTLASLLGPAPAGSRSSTGSDGSNHQASPTLMISPANSLGQIPSMSHMPPPANPAVSSPPANGKLNSALSSSSSSNSKKRKRPKTAADRTEVISNWETYVPNGAEMFNLYNKDQMEITGTFDMDVKIDSGNAQFSEEDGGWIFYRQNQFQVTAELLGTLHNYTPKGAALTTTTTSSKKSGSASPPPGEWVLYIEVSDFLRKVESLSLDIRVIKQSRAHLLEGILDEDPNEDKANGVKILQVGASRTKKESKSATPCPFVQGRSIQTKLQFQSATANNAKMQPGVPNPNQQYFRIVASLLAKVVGTEESFLIVSKISPPVIVRGQSPGRYPHQTGEGPQPSGWKGDVIGNNEITYFQGNVGVNTSNPTEALTVNGNVLITGNIVKPSDVRLKSEFQEVSPSDQLKNIEQLKIYDYNIVNPLGGAETRRERGVIAQEVKKTIPHAVHVVGDVTLEDDTRVPDLLVVNDHVLLLENIGATQHLSELLREEHDNIKVIDNQIKDLEASTEESESVVTTKLLSVLDYISSEEALENNRHCYCSFFGLGPAWSLFLLGFVFTGIPWIFGIFYICSTNHVKRVAGVANLVMAVVLVTYYIVVGLYGFNPSVLIFTTAGLLAIGALCMLVMSLYGRKRSLERETALRQMKNLIIQKYTKSQGLPLNGSPLPTVKPLSPYAPSADPPRSASSSAQAQRQPPLTEHTPLLQANGGDDDVDV